MVRTSEELEFWREEGEMVRKQGRGWGGISSPPVGSSLASVWATRRGKGVRARLQLMQ